MTFTARNRGAALLLALASLAAPALAGGLDAPGAPTAGSGMPTTADIYNRLNSGAAVSVPGAFQEPAAGPTAGTGKTLGEIAAKLPAPDNSNGAVAADVGTGKTFWSLRTDGTWGLTSGSAPAVIPASGTAAAAEVLSGKTFSNGSATGINGAMANNGAVTITPGTAAQTIAAGYHNGSGSVAGDSNLVAGNIRSGATIFGVSGSLTALDMTHVASISCVNHWSGANCDICSTGWVGASCNACVTGWLGGNCDIIAKPFPTTVPAYASTPWKCVSDSNTGLTWEVKTTSGGLHSMYSTYSWYDSTYTANPGIANGGVCNASGCDTEKFVAAVNAEQLCGHTDWRMPSIGELQGLVVTGSPPTIDSTYFHNTMHNIFWSGSSYAPDPTSAWYVHFFDGSSDTRYQGFNNFVRLVRSGP